MCKTQVPYAINILLPLLSVTLEDAYYDVT